MRIFLLILGICLFPELAHAQEAGSASGFTPPATDLSIVLLGYIFGIVDGVLHGTGSQIVGQMFSVFNSAVLFLGGVVLSWTLGKGVLDTAHEGELLGRNKSSMWIPARVAAGTALLLPKATGYCVLQIVIMWLVVQGVGVADKIWDNALNYLQRGGVIVAKGFDPEAQSKHHENKKNFDAKVDSAANMLVGQLCMYGVERFMDKMLTVNKQYIPKTVPAANIPPTPVPDFIASVDIIANKTTGTVTLPNFESTNFYAKLNGICGSINWKVVNYCTSPGQTNCTQPPAALKNNVDLINQVQEARSIAVQQMYLDLSPTARTIVGNFINNLADPSNMLELGHVVCSGGTCEMKTYQGGPALLVGNELYNAALDYFAIMRPNLNLLASAGKDTLDNFIPKAKKEGWLLAGAYFFNLVALNQAQKDLSGEPADTLTVSGPTPCPGAQGSQGYIQTICKIGTVAKTLYPTIPNPLFGTFRIKGDAQPIQAAVDMGYLMPPSIAAMQPSQLPKGYNIQDYIFSAKSYSVGRDTSGAAPLSDVSTSIKVENVMPSIGCGGIGGFMHIPRAICGVGVYIAGGLISWVEKQAATGIDKTLNFFLQPIEELPLGFLDYLMNNVTVGAGNPVLSLAALGRNFINVTTTIWVGGSIAIGIATPVTGGASMATFAALAAFLLPLFGAFFVSGVMMAFYLPLVPYMLFTFGGIAWLISVIEAMVAGPLVAFGIIYPEGHETWGKSEPAIMLLLNVFFRPAMMVLGFIFGIILSFVGIWLLNLGFGYVANLLITASGASAGGGATLAGAHLSYLIAPIFMIIIYISMVTAIIHRAYSLIHVLPDKVLRFLQGGQGEALGGQMTGEMMQQAKQSVSDSAGKISQAGQSSMQSQISSRQRQQEKGGSASGGGSFSMGTKTKSPGSGGGGPSGGGGGPSGGGPSGGGGGAGGVSGGGSHP